MLEVTDKSLRARRSVPCCRHRDGPDQSAVSSAGPQSHYWSDSSLPRLPQPASEVSFLPLEEVHRPKPWLNYPAAAAKAMRSLARANRECSDCRIASLSLSPSLVLSLSLPLAVFLSFFLSFSLPLFLPLSLSLSLSLLARSLAHSLFPLYIAFFRFALLFFPLFLLHWYTI